MTSECDEPSLRFSFFLFFPPRGAELGAFFKTGISTRPLVLSLWGPEHSPHAPFLVLLIRGADAVACGVLVGERSAGGLGLAHV